MFVGGAQTARERKPLGKHLRSAVCVSNWNFLFYLGILLQNYLPLTSSHNDLVMFALVIFFAKTQRKYRRVAAQTNIILPVPPNISINRMQTDNFNSEQIKRKYLKTSRVSDISLLLKGEYSNMSRSIKLLLGEVLVK